MIITYQLSCLKLIDIGIKLKKVISKLNFNQLHKLTTFATSIQDRLKSRIFSIEKKT